MRRKHAANARLALDQTLGKGMRVFLEGDIATCKLFVENESIQRVLGDMVFELTSAS